MIFIDTNIYLRFYNENAPAYAKLLDALISISDRVFVPSVVVDEVYRNKLRVFIEGSSNTRKQNTSKGTHQIADSFSWHDSGIDAYNTKMGTARRLLDEIASETDSIFAKICSKVATSSDPVSMKLHSLFKNAVPASSDELVRASSRKQIGNPPGKADDPVGDELSWEQLLTRYNGEQLFLVTNDGDYACKLDEDRLYLNPLLYQDLSSKSSTPPEVLVFNELGKFIKAYEKFYPSSAQNIPDETTLNTISAEERAMNVFNTPVPKPSPGRNPELFVTTSGTIIAPSGAVYPSPVEARPVCTKCGCNSSVWNVVAGEIGKSCTNCGEDVYNW